MTCTILRFPLAASAQPDRRTEIVAAARAVLRSAARHDDDVLTEAADALMSWGNPHTDWWEGYQVRRAIHLRAEAAACTAARKGTIRREMVGLAGFAVIVCAALGVLAL